MSIEVVHVIVDSNILSTAICPKTHEDGLVRTRSQIIFDSVFEANWPSIKLYTPSICIAETINTFDKHRYQRETINKSEYDIALSKLFTAVQNKKIVHIEHEQDHTFLAGLVSPISTYFASERAPMSATDCVIAAVGILLKSRLSYSRVVVITADQRFATVINKAKSLSTSEASGLDLQNIANKFGLEWSKSIYPDCLDIKNCSEINLSSCFLGWPLPGQKLRIGLTQWLSKQEQIELNNIWDEMKIKYHMKDVDKLPYTPALEEIRVTFATRKGRILLSNDIFHRLLTWRKGKRWPNQQIQS
jgi:hypothetical protein